MKIFFGKISKKYDKTQLEEGYYRSPRDSSWFNGIQPGDYSFIIGGGKIQLWQAVKWDIRDGNEILKFDIIHKDLNINTKQFTAIKYFNVTMELVVLTVRSTAKSKKAFYQINITSEFTEELLKDINTYMNENTFRKIHICEGAPFSTSQDIQLYRVDTEWKMYPSQFISATIKQAFKDNTSMLGNGQINKDKTIEVITDSANAGVKLSTDTISILQVYDLFCCDYKSKEIPDTPDDEIEDETDTPGFASKNRIYYGPPGTGKTREILKIIDDLDTNEKIGLQIPSQGNLNLNNTFWHLAPGRNGRLWDQLKAGDALGYEWCGKELGDLKNLSPTVDNYKITRRLADVKNGDYFCIISGRKCLAIAQAIEDYNYPNAKNNPFHFQTVKIKWLGKFETPILLNASSTMSFSGINDGERWKSLIDGLVEKGFTFGESIVNKKIFKKLYKFTTFHQSYSYEDFIEGIKPKLTEEKNEDDLEEKNEIEYEIKPGLFYDACDKAAQLANYDDLQDSLGDTKENRIKKFAKAQPYYLFIDEINRGNIANIFGELITLIEDDKRLGGEYETIVSLPYSRYSFGVPGNLILIGTMNTADRSIEALDSALRRRFTFIEKPPEPTLLKELSDKIKDIDLEQMLQAINDRLEVILDSDHCIGHSYFLKVTCIDDMQTVFKNKIIPLLKEYFYGKPQMIGLVLGPDFVKTKTVYKKLFTAFNTEFSEYSEKQIYQIVIPTKWEDYKRIYEP